VGLGLQLLLMVLVVATAVRATQDGLHATDIRGAEDAAAHLLSSMADQQTGLLTYLKPAQPDSLLLYSAGRAETQASLASLRAHTGGSADAGREARLEAAVRDWQRWAEDLYAQQRPITDPVVIAYGSHLFALFVDAQHQLVTSFEVESRQAQDQITSSTVVSVAAVAVESLAVAALMVTFSLQVARRVLTPLRQLARAAEQVAREGLSQIPYRGRGDEVGQLARALQGWQDVSAVRTILAEHAPVGICQIGTEGQITIANPALERMLHRRRGELVGASFWTLVHPDDHLTAARVRDGLAQGAPQHDEIECRLLRGDGSSVWCSVLTTPVQGADGRPGALVGIIQDITERKQRAERAAEIQRDLLPGEKPALEGYDLAAALLPFQDVSGDLYDWTGPEDGHLDLTVADVVSRGAGAALAMATLRMALRAMPEELDPKARVGLAAKSMARVLDDSLSLKLFHGRLELESGMLRYVTAGNDCSVVRRAGGEIVRLATRSLPLGASNGGEYEERTVRLGPGDALLLCTNGLVETVGGEVELEELMAGLKDAKSADEAVARLSARVVGRQRDDATAVLLRREPARPPRVRTKTA
jgi:PAS domain S-box-containing protein